MHTGTYISGAGHLLLIGWTLFGVHPNPDPLPFEVQSVSIVTGAEFEAIMAAERPPFTVAEPTALILPVTPAETPPEAPATDVAPTPVTPPQAEAPPPDPVPQSTPEPPPAAEIVDAVPQPLPPAESQAALVPPSTRPQPRPSDRVAPEAVSPPPPDAAPDPVEREAVSEDPSAEDATPVPPQEATAPEEAATEIVTEAETPAGAPQQSIRPLARPQRQAAVEPPPETPAPSATRDAVNAALAEALTETAPTAAPSGPPLSAGEKEGLRVAVSSCWNVGSLSTEALGTTVVVGVTMTEDARPVQGAIRMLSFEGGSEAAARQAFEAARRAIIRCGTNGFGLPVEKFDHWREIEMTFNPERMRIK